MAADRSSELKVDPSLIDSNFDGYKLSLDPLATYRVTLDSDLDVAQLTDSQYSYQHAKAFGVHNHLFLDQWNQHVVFFVDDNWKVMKAAVTLDTNLERPLSSFQIPEASNQRLAPERLNVSIQFPSPEWVVLGDGAGKLYLIHTGSRTEDQNWKVCFADYALGDRKCFSLLHTTMHSDNETHRLECLLLHVDKLEDNKDDNKAAPFVTVLEWLTLISVDKTSWSLDRTRRLRGKASPDYAVIEHRGVGVLLAAAKPFQMVYDSLKPVEPPKPPAPPTDQDTNLPAYTWNQDSDDVTVHFTLPATASKADILFKLTADQVELGIKNGETLLQGLLHHGVDVEASTWTVSQRRLELMLNKEEPGTWSEVVVGDARGELVIDENSIAQIHERLAHLTSENMNPDPQGNISMPYNAQQLEDCDVFPDESSVMQRFDGETHQVTHKINTDSHQWLFNAQSEPEKLPIICLRHDVDGLIWRPVPDIKLNQQAWEHVGTFNALGYVLASKRDRKFGACAPNLSFSAMSDCVRHVYIYRQPAPILSPLRNRKSGREVAAIAKQMVVSLESTESIMGFQATNDRLFILAGRMLHIVRVNIDSSLP